MKLEFRLFGSNKLPYEHLETLPAMQYIETGLRRKGRDVLLVQNERFLSIKETIKPLPWNYISVAQSLFDHVSYYPGDPCSDEGDEILERIIEEAKTNFPDIDFRYMGRPSSKGVRNEG